MSENQHAICPECKTANPASSKFCNNCGASLEAATVVPEMAAAPAAPEAQAKKKRRWPVIIGAVVGLCIVLMILAALFGGGDSDDPGAPAATERPTEVAEGPTEAPTATTPLQTDTPILPTDTPLPPTNTPIPSDTPLPTETPEPTVTKQPAVIIQGATAYTSEYGTYHVVGEIRNNSDDALSFVRIVGTFHDDQNQVVATDFTYTGLDIVDAGGLAPFDLTLLDPPDTITSYKLAVQYRQASENPLRVTITSHSGSMSDYGTYNVVGEVENPYDFPITFVRIVGTFYDGAGDVVRVDFTYTGLDTVPAGQTSPFDLALLEPSSEMDHYVLQTQSRKQ